MIQRRDGKSAQRFVEIDEPEVRVATETLTDALFDGSFAVRQAAANALEKLGAIPSRHGEHEARDEYERIVRDAASELEPPGAVLIVEIKR